MTTELEVYIESDYNHTNKFEGTRQKIEKAAFYTQSLFKVIRLANANFESIADDGDAKDVENYIEDLNNLCEIGSGLAFSVFREASNFSLYTFKEKGEKVEVQEIEKISDADDLAVSLSKILNNPELPITLYNRLQEAIAEVYTDGDGERLNRFESSPEFLQAVIEASRKDEQ